MRYSRPADERLHPARCSGVDQRPGGLDLGRGGPLETEALHLLVDGLFQGVDVDAGPGQRLDAEDALQSEGLLLDLDLGGQLVAVHESLVEPGRLPMAEDAGEEVAGRIAGAFRSAGLSQAMTTLSQIHLVGERDAAPRW